MNIKTTKNVKAFSIFDILFDFVVKKSEKNNKKEKTPIQKTYRTHEICLNKDGKIVKCKVTSAYKTVTTDGEDFTGTIKKTGKNGERINVQYEQGYKTQKNIGNNTVKFYSEDCTKLVQKDLGTVSEVKINESIINNNCKSMIYFDPEINFARIDFDNTGNGNFKDFEIRYNGTVSGLAKDGSSWKPYFIKNGLDVAYDKENVAKLYKQIKQIIKECKDNSLMAEKNSVNNVEKQIDGICQDIIYNV